MTKSKFFGTSLQVLVILIGLYAGIWVFNHISAWIGIAAITLIILNIIYKLTTFFKKL